MATQGDIDEASGCLSVCCAAVSPRRHVRAVAYDCCCRVVQFVNDAGKGDVAALRRGLANGVDVNAKRSVS